MSYLHFRVFEIATSFRGINPLHIRRPNLVLDYETFDASSSMKSWLASEGVKFAVLALTLVSSPLNPITSQFVSVS